MPFGFWGKIKKPIMALAPMADVTDAAFRQIVAKYGHPDVVFTEFVSCDGLCSEGKERLLHDLVFHKKERPICAQLFGANPDNFLKSAKLIRRLGFDGIDINMGCPEKKMQQGGACASLMKNPTLAKEIILATKAGAGDLPVSVKTRLGYHRIEIDTWIPALLEASPAAILLHGRTKKAMFTGTADWSAIKKAGILIKKNKSPTLLIGNGDILTLEDAYQKAKKYGVDGVMVGRAVWGNPWFFNPKKQNVSLPEKIKVLIEHCYLFEKLEGELRPFALMKKHFKPYLSGFTGAKELRIKLYAANNAKEVEAILKTVK